MLFVVLCSVRGGTSRERVARRVEWRWPEGLRVVGEYWLQTPDPIVVSIVEADGIAPLMTATADWDDVFSVTVVPAVSAEEGLRIARERLGQA